MIRYVIQRILAALVTIWITTIAVTLLIHAVPGDPVRIMYAKFQSTPEQIEAVRTALGLDQPIWVQYGLYIGRLLEGDLGRSIVGNQPVLDILLTRFPATLHPSHDKPRHSGGHRPVPWLSSPPTSAARSSMSAR